HYLSCSCHSFPTRRSSDLIVGFDRERYGSEVDFEFNLTPQDPKPVMRDILEKKVDDKYTLSDKLWTYLQNYAAKHKAAGNGFGRSEEHTSELQSRFDLVCR